MTAEDTMEDRLDSPDPEQRRLAVATLSQTRGSSTVQKVIRALGDEDWRVRKEATTVAIEIGPLPELLDALVDVFSSSDNVGLRNAATEALAGFGQAAVVRIANEVPLLDADGRKLAAEALGRAGHPGAVTVLGNLLQDCDVNVRVAAIEALGLVGGARTDEVGELLCAFLRSEHTLERLASLDAVNSLGIILDWEHLQAVVTDPILERAALVAAARSGATEASSLLVEALICQASYAQEWPVLALAEYIVRCSEERIGPPTALRDLPQPVRGFLLGLTDADDAETRTAALVVLAAIGDEETSRWVLDAAERDEMSGVAEQVLGATVTLHPAVLEERLKGAAAGQRAIVFRMLARNVALLPRQVVLDEVANAIAADADLALSDALEVLESLSDERCFQLLVDRFSSLPTAVSQTSMVVLGEMAQRHPALAHSFLSAGPYCGEQRVVVTVLLAALSRIGETTSPESMELLFSCLLADEAAVRSAALAALAEIGDISAADAIDFLLADEEPEVRLAAVRALGRLRRNGESTAVVGRLIDIAQKTEDRELLVAAVQAIGETSDPRALSVLRPLLGKSSEPSVAVAAVEAIGRVSDTRRLEALIDGLSHPDVDVLKAAMRLLVHERDIRVEAHLGAFLDHEAWGVRRLAADLLGQRGGEVAAGLLRAKRATEREPLVREALERALGAVEGTQPSRRSTPAPGQGSWRPR